MTTTLPPLHTLRSQQSTTSLSHRGSNSADSTIVDAVRKEMTIASTHTSMFSITEHDSWNQFRDPKLEESFLMYHNARNKRSVLRVVTFVFVFILIENTLDFIKIGWEEHKVPGMLSVCPSPPPPSPCSCSVDRQLWYNGILMDRTDCTAWS